jgi:hypothetical protein
MSSLEILEECLHRIYVCRRNISSEKSRISALKSGKRKHSKPIETPPSSSSLSIQTNQLERNDLAEKNAKVMTVTSSNSNMYDSNFDIITDNDTISTHSRYI